MDLLTGKHFFAPPNVPENDELFDCKVLIRQLAFFGPFPDKYAEIAAPVQEIVDSLNNTVRTPGLQQKYQRTLAGSMHAEDLAFLFYFMKTDLRDRPSAAQLLQHSWFSGV